MSDFVPEGYLTIRSAFDEALDHWFGEQIASTRKRIEKQIEEEQVKAAEAHSLTDSPTDRVRDALIRGGASDRVEQKLTEACGEQNKQTGSRLRNALHKGQLTAVYFPARSSSEEPTPIARGKWATPATDNVIFTSEYFPSGRRPPGFSVGYYPSEQVLVREEELKRFLVGEVTATQPARRAAKPSVVNKVGRPSGTRFQQADDAIIEEMRQLIERREARNRTDAARKLASKALGSGVDSIVSRLLKGYRQKYPRRE